MKAINAIYRPVIWASSQQDVTTTFINWFLPPAVADYPVSAAFGTTAGFGAVATANKFASLGSPAFPAMPSYPQFTVVGTIGLPPSASADIYFPTGVLYKMGYKPGRTWATVVSEGPTGRVQKRSLRPKKQTANLTVMCYANGLPDEGAFLTMRSFESQLQGRARNFLIFDPHAVNFSYSAQVVIAAGVMTNGPIVLPWISGSQVVSNAGGLATIGGNLPTYDNGGAGGELRLITWPTSSGNATYTVTWTVTGGRARYRMAKSHDTDIWDFDWSAAAPAVEVTMDLVEEFN